MLEEFENNRRGITGYFANFHSMITNMIETSNPKTMRHMTLAESQGNVIPPNSKPSRNMTVPPTMARLPNQSTALSPAPSGVLGLSKCKNKESATMTLPVIGKLM